MNTEKLTQKSMEAIRSANSLAVEYGNQQIDQAHLFLALLSQQDGLIPQIIPQMGTDLQMLQTEAQRLVDQLPKVSGSGREPDKVYVTPGTDKALNAAEKAAQRMQDEYVSVEHLFLGLIQTAEGKLAQLLKSHDLTEQKLLTVLQTVRGSTKVTSDNPEGTYNVLKKNTGRIWWSLQKKQQAGSGHRQRRGDPERDPDPVQKDQEQPGSDR